MIQPVRGRSTFQRLRREGHRARSRGLSVTYAPPDEPTSDAVRVAFAIGRAVGNAVTRNRLRRRLRHLLADAPPEALPPGTYLFRLDPALAHLTYQELTATVMSALDRLRAGR